MRSVVSEFSGAGAVGVGMALLRDVVDASVSAAVWVTSGGTAVSVDAELPDKVVGFRVNPASEVSLGWVARVVSGVLEDTVDASLTAEV